MSHVAEIECRIKDLEALRKAADALGADLVEASTYKWYGRSVGDYPLPEGVKAEDLGKCDYKLAFREKLRYRYNVGGREDSYEGMGYEVGVCRKEDGSYRLQWDFFDEALKQHLGGETAPRLVQRYAAEVAKAQLRLKGYQVKERVLEDGTIELRQTIYG